MPERDLLAEGVDLLSREALYIDMRRWEEWIDLYHEDAIFWAPAWRNDEELTKQGIILFPSIPPRNNISPSAHNIEIF